MAVAASPTSDDVKKFPYIFSFSLDAARVRYAGSLFGDEQGEFYACADFLLHWLKRYTHRSTIVADASNAARCVHGCIV